MGATQTEAHNTIDPRAWDWHFGEQCGLNADWSVRAWQVSEGISGDDGHQFIIELESKEPTFVLVRRWYLHELNKGAYQAEGNATFEIDRYDYPCAFDGHSDGIVHLLEFATAEDVIHWIKTHDGGE